MTAATVETADVAETAAVPEFSDLSHWNPSINFALYKDHELGLKATDGSSVDPDYEARVTTAGAKGIAVHHYDFGELGDPAAQARFFVETVTPHWKFGDFATIDDEIAGFDGNDSKIWQGTVHELRPAWQQEIYGGFYFLEGAGIVPLFDALFWLAAYTKEIPGIPRGFKRVDRWQFSSTATVPGIAGKGDRSRILVPAPKPPDSHAPSPFVPNMADAVKRATEGYTGRIKDDHPMDAGAQAKTHALIREATEALKIKESK